MVQPVSNPYPGINAHFNSRLQVQGEWPEFHTVHIGDLAKTLKAAVSPLGYNVGVERSLQVWRGDEIAQKRPDVAIFDRERSRGQSGVGGSSTGVLTLPLPELIALEADDDYVPALVIARPESGEPIAWIELLSPSNKPPEAGFVAYDDKRRDVLHAGLVFVEIDYLHQQPPTFRSLRDYSAGDEAASPYRIVVIDPRPTPREGDVHLYEFGVESPIPTVIIPLNGAESLDFDFGVPYRKTFEEGLYGPEIDYSLPPAAFETYQPRDRARIIARMEALTRA